MNKFYNIEEDKQFSNLLTDLKNLPKIEAPENFEFNLMTKIQNGNFNQGEAKPPKFNLLKFFAPSAAVLAAIILFFIFYPEQQEIQTQIAQKNIVDDSQTIAGNASDKKIESLFNKPEKKKDNRTAKPNIPQSQNLAPKSQLANQNQMYNPTKSVSVDDYISGINSNQKNPSRNSVVNSGENPLVDGFLVEKKTDKKTIEKFRTQIDSIRKAQLKADSLKKVNK